MVDRKTLQEAITLCTKVDNTIYVYFKGMEYSYNLENENFSNYKGLSHFRDKLISSVKPITLEEFCFSFQIKGQNSYVIAFPLSKLTLIDVLHFCSRELSNASYRIHIDMEYVALDDDNLEKDYFVCVRHQDDYVIAEIGNGVIEYKAIGKDGSLFNYVKDYGIDSISELDDIQYRKSLIHGMLVQYLISLGCVKDILPLYISCINNIDCIIEVKGAVRDFKHLYSRETLPAKQNVELYLDNGRLYLYFDDSHIPIPIYERWGYSPNRINVGIDIDAHNRIEVTVTDCSNNRKLCLNLIDLLPQEEELSTEENQETSFSKEEQEYLGSVRDYLEESEEIDARGRRLLNRLRERLGITVERAEELELSLQTVQLTEEEKEYLEEYQACLEEGEISAKERRLLDRLRDKLNISEQRAKEIEKCIV